MKFFSLTHRGFTLAEGILALSLLTSLLVLGSQHLQRQLEQPLQQGVAEHLRWVAKAAEQYVLNDYRALGDEKEKGQWEQAQARAQKKNDKLMTREQWRYWKLRKRYLPDYLNVNNCYQQQYTIYITEQSEPSQTAGPNYQILVITDGGNPIAEKDLRLIAEKLGKSGGYISHTIKDQDNKTCIAGNRQQWQMALPKMTCYQADQDPSSLANSGDQAEYCYADPGHLVNLSFLYQRDIIDKDSLLHRTETKNQSHLNTMETSLAMQDHQIKFQQGDAKSTLSTEKMELSKPSPDSSKSTSEKSAISLQYDEQAKPKIDILHNENEIFINTDGISFSNKKLPENWKGKLENYSPSELHPYWNKLPYYQLKKINPPDTVQNFANDICSEGTPPVEKYSTIGRMFLIGWTGSNNTQLKTEFYMCQHTDRHLKKSQAVRILDLSIRSDQTSAAP